MTKRVICIQGTLLLLFLLARIVNGREPKLGSEKAPKSIDILHRERRQLLFPNTTLLQLNIGVTVPTPVVSSPILCNWAFQANFQLPWNRTQIPSDIFLANSGYEGDSRVVKMKRDVNENDSVKKTVGIVGLNDEEGEEKDDLIQDFDKTGYKSDSRLHHFYQTIEGILDGFGYEGSVCVLRTLCQLAKEPLHSDDNEDLLHELATFVLDPNNGVNGYEQADEDVSSYLEAFKMGRSGQDCAELYRKCSIDLVDMFTALY